MRAGLWRRRGSTYVVSFGDSNSESILLGSPGGNSHSLLLSSLFVLFYFLKHIYILIICLYPDVYRCCPFSCFGFLLNGPTSTSKREGTNLCPICVPLEGVTGSCDLHYLSLCHRHLSKSLVDSEIVVRCSQHMPWEASTEYRGPFLTGREDDQFEVRERLCIGPVERLEDTPGLQKGRAVHRSHGPCASLGPGHHLWPREGG